MSARKSKSCASWSGRRFFAASTAPSIRVSSSACSGRPGLTGGIDEESAEQVQKLVPGRARDRPARGQLFVRYQDLLDHDPGSWRGLLQPAQVLLRVTQSVGVVDAQSSDHAGRQPAQNHAVCGQKNVLVLDANRGQGVDVEESPVVKLRAAGTPPGQAIVLAFEQLMQELTVRIGCGDQAARILVLIRVRIDRQHLLVI